MIRVLMIIILILILTFPILSFGATITLALNPNSTSEPAGYKIYWGESPGIYPVSLDLGWYERDVQFNIVTNLPAGKMLYFVATAYDSSGNESSFSSEVSRQVPGGQLPEIPKNYRIVESL